MNNLLNFSFDRLCIDASIEVDNCCIVQYETSIKFSEELLKINDYRKRSFVTLNEKFLITRFVFRWPKFGGFIGFLNLPFIVAFENFYKV